MNRKHVLWKLFVSTLYLSAFTFGGGYVIVTLMKEKFVDELHWMEEDEMLDLIAIAQSAPGAIAVNGAIVVGYKLAGLLGALVAIVATIIPPFVIITVISYFYELFRDNFIVSKLLAGMQAGVGAVIASVVWDMGGGILKQKSAVSDFIMLAAFSCRMRIPRECGLYHPRLHRPRRSADGACKKEDGCMMYLQLFLSFLQIGALSFGGGYAAMPLIEAQIVTTHGWLTMTEFANLVTIAEMTPGPIAVNAATFVGTKIAGVPGALAATAGCILPACILVTLIAKLYLKYRNLSVLQSVLGSLRPAVVAMIASAGVTILLNAFWGGRTIVPTQINCLMIGIFALSFFLLRKTKLNPIAVMVLAGIVNLLAGLCGIG